MLCGLSVSCLKWGSRQNIRLIEQAQQLVEQMPDSALTLLDMVNAASFGNAAKAEYVLLRVQARSNAGLDLSKDTEIFQAKEYFTRRKNREKAALVCFYAGETLFAQGKVTEAVEFYLEANDFTNQLSDDQFKGRIFNRIGDANYMLVLYEHSLSCWMQALVFYRAAGNMRSEIGSMIKIGNCYLLENQNDSAFALYRRAERMAYSQNDTTMQLAVLQNMGVAYMEKGDQERAVDMYHAALVLATRRDSVQLFSNLASLYWDAGQPDTAFTYNNIALTLLDSTVNNPLLLNIYHQMLLIEAHKGNGDKVIDYFSKYLECLDEVLDTEEKKSLLDIQRKYDFEKAQSEYSIKKRNFVIAILSALIAAFGFMFWSLNLRKGKKQHERTIARLLLQLDALHEMKDQLQKLKAEANSANENSDTEELNHLKKRYDEQLRTFTRQYFHILSRIEFEFKNTPDETPVKMERINRILFGSAHIDFWSATEKLIPERLPEKIKKICPELDKTELRICCLTYLNVDTAAMSLALGVKDSTIYSLNSRIREKFGIGVRKNIRRFLEEKLTD